MRCDILWQSVRRPTLIEPLHRHGLINRPSSWSGPSKQIRHCAGPFEGTLRGLAPFTSPTPLFMLADGSATCEFDLRGLVPSVHVRSAL